jgi:hypothetical protein
MSAATPVPTPVQGAPDANQIPQATAADVSSIPQPKVRQKGKSTPVSSEGVRESGSESGAVEAVTEEKITPTVSPTVTRTAGNVLKIYDKSVSSNTEPPVRDVQALHTTAGLLGLQVAPDAPHAEVAAQIREAIKAPEVVLPQGLKIAAAPKAPIAPTTKAALQAKFMEHAKAGTLGEASEAVKNFAEGLRTSKSLPVQQAYRAAQ